MVSFGEVVFEVLGLSVDNLEHVPAMPSVTPVKKSFLKTKDTKKSEVPSADALGGTPATYGSKVASVGNMRLKHFLAVPPAEAVEKVVKSHSLQRERRCKARTSSDRQK